MSGRAVNESARGSGTGRELTPRQVDRLVRRLNTEYYSANPHTYFHERLAHLFVVAAAPEKLDALVADELKLGELTLGFNTGETPIMSPLVDDATREKYVAIESTVLLHHVAEVLLRLELAHERQPRCPWLEMVNLTWDFKDKLKERFPERGRHPDDSRLLFPVYYLGLSREEVEFNDNSLQPDLDNISAFLHHFARLHIKEAAIYNSAKHGLGVVAGETQFDMQGLFEWKSMSIAGLDRTGHDVSHMLMRSVNVERDLQFSVFAVNLIRQLWDVARARYIDAEKPLLNMFAQPKFKEVNLGCQKMTIEHLRVPLSLFGVDPTDESSRPTPDGD